MTLLECLGETDDVGERVRAMDGIVESIEQFPSLKLEVSLEEYLPSYALRVHSTSSCDSY